MGLLKEFKQHSNILDSSRIKDIEICFLNNSNNEYVDSYKEYKKSFLDNFCRNAKISIFDEKRDETGKNQWDRLAKDNILTTSSTKIGAIVSNYSKKDFFVDQSCVTLLNMLTWSPEDKKIWKRFDSELHSFVYNQGNTFESLIPMFFKKNFPDYLVKNWNLENKGLFLETYKSKIYNIYCRPDFLLYKKDSENKIVEGIIVEVKSSSSKTKRLENYKYQLALQSLLIHYFYPDSLIRCCLLFNDQMIEYSYSELKILQEDILKYIPMFWEDFRTGNYKKISVNEYIEFIKNGK